MQPINSFFFFSFTEYIYRKLVSECFFFFLIKQTLWKQNMISSGVYSQPALFASSSRPFGCVRFRKNTHTQWWTAFPWRLCIFISQLDTMSCVLLWSIRGWALGWNGQKDSVRFSSFAGMIESVCEGAECWESCIAVSGLFQTIDR